MYMQRILIFMAFFASGCYSMSQHLENNNDCQIVRIRFDIPLLHSSGVIIDDINDSFDIFYFDTFTVYKYYMLRDYIEEEQKVQEIIPEYFVFTNCSSTGYFFDWQGGYNIFSIDSFLSSRGLSQVDVSFDLADAYYEIAQKDTLVRYFLPKKPPDENVADTIKLHFSEQWKNVPFQLSKTIKWPEPLKVFRASFIFNSRKYPGLPYTSPSREIYLELRPAEGISCEEAVIYIKKFRQLRE